MPCKRALPAYRTPEVNPDTGKHGITFNAKKSFPADHPNYEEISLPCGQCLFCRIDYSRQWATRAVKEGSLYRDNCFVTLTYSPENLPPDGKLDYKAPSLFMGRLRQKFGSGIRSFGCAEYGEDFGRPHYHLILFNHDFHDKRPFKRSGDFTLYRSPDLESLWPYGHSSVAEFNYETAAYVARYTVKKIKSKTSIPEYERVDPRTGEVTEIPPRSCAVSRRPGIGSDWVKKNSEFLLNHDYVVVNGAVLRPPKFFDNILKKLDPERFESNQQARIKKGQTAMIKLGEEDKANFQRAFKKGTGPLPLSRLSIIEIVEELTYNQSNNRSYDDA